MTPESLQCRLSASEWSMYRLAAALGVSRVSVWRWVHGEEPIPPKRAEQIEGLLPIPTEAA